MSRRPLQIKTFSRTPRRDSDPETTVRKMVWNPSAQNNQNNQNSQNSQISIPSLPSMSTLGMSSLPSVQSLFSKVVHVEERLDHLETLISRNTDLDLKEQEQVEVTQSRHELADMHRQLEEAVLRLQRREVDFQDTKNAMADLSKQAAVDRQKIHNLEAEKKALHQLIQDLETKLNERVKKVGHLEKEIANMQCSLRNTNNRLESMQHQMEKMQQQMKDFAEAQSRPPAPTATTTTTAAASSSSSQSPTTSNTIGVLGSEGSSSQVSSPTQKQNGGGAGKGTAGTTPRHVTSNALGLPPIQMPPSHMTGGGKTSARGGGGKNVVYNFPPK